MVTMTLAQQIADAQAQYHLLMTGQKASVLVDQNGERIEFFATNASALAAYIAKLQSQLVNANKPSHTRPMGFYF